MKRTTTVSKYSWKILSKILSSLGSLTNKKTCDDRMCAAEAIKKKDVSKVTLTVQSFAYRVGDLAVPVWYSSFSYSRTMWSLVVTTAAVCHKSYLEGVLHQCTGLRQSTFFPKLGYMLTDLLKFFKVHSAVVCNNLAVKKSHHTSNLSPHYLSDLSLITISVSDYCSFRTLIFHKVV